MAIKILSIKIPFMPFHRLPLYIMDGCFTVYLLIQESPEEDVVEKKDIEEEARPDPLTQLITSLSRGAQEQRSASCQDDLYTSYAEIMSLVSTLVSISAY